MERRDKRQTRPQWDSRELSAQSRPPPLLSEARRKKQSENVKVKHDMRRDGAIRGGGRYETDDMNTHIPNRKEK